MEERNINEHESLEIITAMIQKTKSRVQKGNGNILLLWGYLSIIIAITTTILCYITKDPMYNFLWLGIPILGYPLSKCKKFKNNMQPVALTYIDKISMHLWSMVGLIALIQIAICFIFEFAFNSNIWISMFIYAFIIVGIGVLVQGIILKESSLMAGGGISIFLGCIVTSLIISRFHVDSISYIILYIISMVASMIIPGHILNYKLKKQQ